VDAVDYAQMGSYDEAKVPKPYLRRTPRGHWLEADRVVDPLLLEWLDINTEKAEERLGDSPADAGRLARTRRAAEQRLLASMSAPDGACHSPPRRQSRRSNPVPMRDSSQMRHR
jgi:hypothetical protein